MSLNTFYKKGYTKKCPVCEGVGKRLDMRTKEERVCSVCSGLGVIVDKEAKEFISRSHGDLKSILPKLDQMTEIISNLNERYRKENDRAKKAKIEIIRDEMIELKNQLF